MPVYDSGAETAPDSGFEPGGYAFLAVGNAGRMRDARRTPMVITAVDPDVGMFELELRAFEDVGARWSLPFEDVGRFQFDRDARRVATADIEAAVARFDRPLVIDVDPAMGARTHTRIATLAAQARQFLSPRFAGVLDLECRDGDPLLFDTLDAWMRHHDVADLDAELAGVFVSNPHSGERVKGHAVVLAELGLCPYTGRVVRSPHEFAGRWSRDRRARHVICRLAFVRAMFVLAGPGEVTLYRGLASDNAIDTARARSFVSATFSREVAEAHFEGGEDTVAAALLRHRVPVERVLMTYLETRALNAQYREAEAVLIADPAVPLF